jgi:hypothetical protein
MLSERIVKVQAWTQLVQLSMVTFSLASAMNTVVMSSVSFQHGDLMVMFWTAVHTVITFKLLPVITLLAMSQTVYMAVTDVSFQHDNLMIPFFLTSWTTVSTVITFKLLPVITLLAMSEMVYTAVADAFRERGFSEVLDETIRTTHT